VLYDLSPNREYVSKIVGKDRVHIVAGDMRDLPALMKTVVDYNATTVVHTAGLIGSRVAENPYMGIAVNIQGTVHLLELVGTLKLARFIYVSSRAVYDRSKIKDGPIREDAPIGGTNFYNVTKVCSELLTRAYAERYGLDAIVIRPGAVFGRGHYAGGSSVGKVMRDLALNILRNKPFEIDSRDYFDNEYAYAKDAACCIEQAYKVKHPQHRIYNCGSGSVTSTEYIKKVVKELFDIEVKVMGKADSQRKVFPLDLSASGEELGFIPKYTFKDALRDYVEEMRRDPV
jgi:nucleoside-diphosphate-sugar epimerase